MKHLTQPNRWTCLPTSFAMAAGITLKEILDAIGHDGSEVIHTHMPEPYRRRAFHIQECVWAVYAMGVCVTPFEVSPQLAASRGLVIDVPRTYDLATILADRGVLTGEIGQLKRRHAVAFESGIVYDPNGRVVIDFQNQPLYIAVDTIWKFDFKNQ